MLLEDGGEPSRELEERDAGRREDEVVQAVRSTHLRVGNRNPSKDLTIDWKCQLHRGRGIDDRGWGSGEPERVAETWSRLRDQSWRDQSHLLGGLVHPTGEASKGRSSFLRRRRPESCSLRRSRLESDPARGRTSYYMAIQAREKKKVS